METGPSDYEGPYADALERARRLADLFDSAVRVPGTQWRVGIGPIVGLIPGIGDAAAMIPAVWIVHVAGQVGVPLPTRMHMLWNIGVDAAIGSVPVLGDLFDAGFRANRKNIDLIDRHLDRERS